MLFMLMVSFRAVTAVPGVDAYIYGSDAELCIESTLMRRSRLVLYLK